MEMLMTPFYFIIFIEKQSLDEEAEGAVVAWGLGPFRMFCVVYSLFLLTDPPPLPFYFTWSVWWHWGTKAICVKLSFLKKI